ncbi:MAG: FGGY-family carbohydrate kinase, partial [Mesorhizobium sp.]
LTVEAAAELGLEPGTPVAAGLIDAHAGGLGTVGARGDAGTLLTRMAYVFGTSACTMTSTRKPTFVKGVWGPYFSAMVPGLWLNEGGQSAAGAAIDTLVRRHPAAPQAEAAAKAAGMSLSQFLSGEAEKRGGAAALPRLVGELHVVPEFLGNRAPFADPDALGIIAGIGMDADIDSLVGLYLAGMCGLGYGARQIVEAERESGIAIEAMVVSGGAGQSALSRQLLADSTGLAVAASTSQEPVLLGASMLGAVAGGAFPDLETAMVEMAELGAVHRPSPATGGWHRHRFEAFELLQKAGRAIRSPARQN